MRRERGREEGRERGERGRGGGRERGGGDKEVGREGCREKRDREQ